MDAPQVPEVELLPVAFRDTGFEGWMWRVGPQDSNCAWRDPEVAQREGERFRAERIAALAPRVEVEDDDAAWPE